MALKIAASTRRDLLKWILATAAAAGRDLAHGAASGTALADQTADTLRDRFWIWTHAEGAYKTEYGLPRTSRMTPVEGAVYLGVANLLFICYSGDPPMPFDVSTSTPSRSAP